MAKLVKTDYEHNIIKALQEVVPDCLFILHGRNGQEPKQGYCLVSIVSETPVGRGTKSSTSMVDVNDKAWQSFQRDYTVHYTMSFIGGSKSKAEEYCRYLSMALGSDFGEDVLIRNGFGLQDFTIFPRAVVVNNNVTQYLTDTIDLTVLTNRLEYFPVEVINEVNIAGDYNLGLNPDSEINVKWQ